MAWKCARRWLSPVITGGTLFSGLQPQPNSTEDTTKDLVKYDDIVDETSNKIVQKMVTANVPGCIVHIDGVPVMEAGFGFSDIENFTPFTCDTSMRIASISKFITALMTLKLAQEGKVDLDKNLVEFLKSNDIVLSAEDKEVDFMNVKHLLNHTSGVRHYHEANKGLGDTTAPEFFSSENYPTIKDALQMFVNDELLFKPGSEFKYTTFGYSLLSFFLEQTSEKSFSKLLQEFTSQLGLHNTRLDSFEDVILNRCRYYCKKDGGPLRNCPYVDNSCKWAGGGMVSTAKDIANLGDIFLYLYQSDSASNYINHESVESMLDFNSVTETERSGMKSHYGYGVKVSHEKDWHGKTLQHFTLSHNGGAVGASCTLFVLPLGKELSGGKPSGVTVVMFNNSCDGDVIRLAPQIAASFAERTRSEDYNCTEQHHSVL